MQLFGKVTTPGGRHRNLLVSVGSVTFLDYLTAYGLQTSDVFHK